MTKITYPCEHMRAHAEFVCEDHPDPWDCADAVIIYNPVFDEYGIPIRDGGRGSIDIAYCPTCGVKLPESQRDAWYDELKAKGFEPFADELPAEYETAAWRLKTRGKHRQ